MPSYPTRLVPYPPAEEALKREIMTHFGHACVCPGCGETTLHLLHLDHIRGAGEAERQRLKRRGTSFYREVKAAIDRDAPGDRLWLDTFQILCLRCNLSKGARDACTLDHLTPRDEQDFQEDTSQMTPEGDATEHILEPGHDAGSAKDRITVRLSAADKRWLQQQPDASVSAAVERLIQERRKGTELQQFIAYQRQVNADLLALLSDLCLKGSDRDPREEALPGDPYRHLSPGGIAEAERAVPLRPLDHPRKGLLKRLWTS